MTTTLERLVREKEGRQKTVKTELIQVKLPCALYQEAFAILRAHKLSWRDLVQSAAEGLIHERAERSLDIKGTDG